MGIIFDSVLPSGGVLIFFSLLRPVSDEKMVPQGVCSFRSFTPQPLWEFKISLIPHWWLREASVWLSVLCVIKYASHVF